MDRVPALEEPLKKLLGGPTAKVMAEHLDLHTVGDLLHHYPRRYEERGQLTKLAELPLDEDVTVVAQVADARVHTFNGGRGQRLEITITDGSGKLQLVFFGRGIHKPHKELLPGSRAMFMRQGVDVQPPPPARAPHLREAGRRRGRRERHRLLGGCPHPDLPRLQGT